MSTCEPARRHFTPGFPRAIRQAAVALAASCFLASAAMADAMNDGAAAFKPLAVKRIEMAVANARKMQGAAAAGDAKAAQDAWKASRRAWETVEPITGVFFPDLDEKIDSWPDAKSGYHAVEAALFAGKLGETSAAVGELVENLAEFHKRMSDPAFRFSPQGLMNGSAKLAYEIGENKSKGGESPYSGTSLADMQENVIGVETVYKMVFEKELKARDARLADAVYAQIERMEDLVGVGDLKALDQPGLAKAGEELAVLLQGAAEKLGLDKPKVGE